MLDCLADRPSLCLGSGMPRHPRNWQQSILFCSWKKAQDRTNTQVFPLNQRPVPLLGRRFARIFTKFSFNLFGFLVLC